MANVLWSALDAWSLSVSKAVAMRVDPYPEVRVQAANVLASNIDTTGLKILTRYFGDGDARVREQVMLAAGRLGPTGLDLALAGLDDTIPLVRQAAVWAASHGGTPAFEPLARHLEKEKSREVLESLIDDPLELGTAHARRIDPAPYLPRPGGGGRLPAWTSRFGPSSPTMPARSRRSPRSWGIRRRPMRSELGWLSCSNAPTTG